MQHFIRTIESLGNQLPHPATLFIQLSVVLIVLSWVLNLFNVSAVHPITEEIISVNNLISQEGLHLILNNTVSNFTGFAPVGTVLVAILGLGIAEKSGLLPAVLQRVINNLSTSWLSPAVVFAGVLSSLAADSGYVILIPLAGIIFANSGKHPLAGIAAAFAGVSGGYGANLMVGPVDAVLAGLSTEAAHLVDDQVSVSILANYYFMVASTLLITLLGGWITEKIILPSLPSWQQQEPAEGTELTPEQRSGLKWAASLLIILTLLILACVLPENGIMRHADTGSILRSPFIKGIVTLISLLAACCGIVYGLKVGRYKERGSIVKDMEDSMATMASYLVLMFFAAQFISYFSWSNIGVLMAIKGAYWLQDSALSATPLLMIFLLVVALINLLIGSASAKWSLLAPVFIPMFLLVGIEPEKVQAAYRIGDSSTNIITPMMPYFGVVLTFMQRYNPKMGIGTIVALMLPYSLCFLPVWGLLLALWLGLGIPLGPNSGLLP